MKVLRVRMYVCADTIFHFIIYSFVSALPLSMMWSKYANRLDYKNKTLLSQQSRKMFVIIRDEVDIIRKHTNNLFTFQNILYFSSKLT